MVSNGVKCVGHELACKDWKDAFAFQLSVRTWHSRPNLEEFENNMDGTAHSFNITGDSQRSWQINLTDRPFVLYYHKPRSPEDCAKIHLNTNGKLESIEAQSPLSHLLDQPNTLCITALTR